MFAGRPRLATMIRRRRRIMSMTGRIERTGRRSRTGRTRRRRSNIVDTDTPGPTMVG